MNLIWIMIICEESSRLQGYDRPMIESACNTLSRGNSIKKITKEKQEEIIIEGGYLYSTDNILTRHIEYLYKESDNLNEKND